MKKLMVAAVLVAMPTAAWAGDKIYSWKAGVTSEQFDRDQEACLAYAKALANGQKVTNPYNPVTQSTVAGAMGAGFAAGIGAGILKAKAFNNGYYGCMTDAGYSQRRFPSAEYKLFKKMTVEQRKARFLELASAPVALHPEMPRDEYD